MQYDNYQRKVEKVASAIRFVMRNMVKIVIAASAVMACVVALLITRGIITDEGTCPETIVYGENIELGAKAFMSKVSYEYASADKDDWSEYMPKLPGEYRMRAVSKGTFGYKRYSDPKTFRVLARPLTVRPNSSFVYGTDPEPNALGLVPGDRIKECEFTFLDMTQDSAIIRPDKESIIIKDETGKDVTSAYDITVTEDTVSMTSRPITIKVYDKIAEYNGKPLTSDAYDITDGEIIDGDTITVTFSENITDVGEILNTPSISIVDSEGNDVTKFYYITESVGKLTVTPRPLVVSTADGSWEYNGEYRFDESYSFGDETSLAEGHTAAVVSHTEIVDAGILANEIYLSIHGENGDDLTSNYSISYTYGTLTVTPRPITITTASNSWEYNDESFHDGGFEISAETPAVDGHVFSVSSYSSITEVGEISNALSFSVKNALGESVSVNNYDINCEMGTLSVTKRPLVINTSNGTWTYDSNPHSSTDYTEDGLLSGHSLTPGEYATITYVGTLDNSASYRVMKGSTDVTDNYDITVNTGILTVEKATLNVTSESLTVIYNANPWSCDRFTQTGLGNNDYIEITESTTLTDVGSVSNKLSFVVKSRDNDEDVSANYDSTFCAEGGTITVTPRPIALVPNDTTKMYDAQLPVTAGFGVATFNNYGLAASTHGIEADLVIENADVNVGEYNIVLENVRIHDGSEDVTHNYEITTLVGKATVNARTITIRSLDYEWIYDGNAHFYERFAVVSDIKPVDGHTVKVAANTEITDAGRLSNVLGYKVEDENGEDITFNYEITGNCGNLTVKPRPIAITTAYNTHTYDDESFFDTGFTVTSDIKPVDGHELTVDTYSEITDVGRIDNKLTFLINGGTALLNNYDITYIYGKLTVTKRDINITTSDGEWNYDGNNHYNTDYSCGDNELIAGHELVATSKTEIRLAKTVDNVVTYKIMKGNKDVTENYNINYTGYGALKVNPIPLDVTTGTATFVYNGSVQYCSDFTYPDEQLVSGESISIKRGTQTGIIEVGSVDNKFEISIKALDGTDVTDCYDISYTYGTITVEAKEITVRPGNVSKIYDGTKLEASGKLVVETLVVGHTITAKSEGGGTDAGIYDLTASDAKITDSDGNDVTHNYSITYTVGKAEVRKRELTVTTASAEKMYDGIPLTNGNYSYKNLLLGHTISVSVTGTVTEVSEVDNTVDASKTVISDANGIDVTPNYEITYVYGKLLVKALKFTVTTPDVEFEYDGKEHYSLYYYAHTAEFMSGGTYEHYTLSVDTYTTLKNAGTVENALTIIIKNPSDEDVTRFFEIEYGYGDITVNKKAVTVTTESAEWVYDGKFHSHEVYTVVGMVDGHTYVTDSIVSVRDVYASYVYPEDTSDYAVPLTDIPDVYPDYSSQNVITIRIYDESNTDVTANYEIDYVYGILNVTPLDITVTTEDLEYVYNGDLYTSGGMITVSEETPLAEGDFVSVISSGYGRLLAGSIENRLYAQIHHEDGSVCTENYNITYEYGTLTVLPREITIKPVGEKVYDGLPLTATFVIAESSKYGLVGGDRIDTVNTTASATITSVGSCECTIISAVINDNLGDDVTYCYNISYETGALTVTPRPVKITSLGATKIYDGTPLINRDYVIDNDYNLAQGHMLSVKITGSITMAGTAPNTFDKESVKVYAIDEGGQQIDVTSNYEFIFAEGTLEVKPRAEVMIITDSVEKIYDGTPLTCDTSGYYLIGGTLVEGDHVEITTTGSITEPGIAPNTASYVIRDKNGNDVSAGYTIIEKFGTLMIFELNTDIDGDGIPDINVDLDGDGIPDINIDMNGDLIPDKNIDTDGDGVPDAGLEGGSDDPNNSGKLPSDGTISSPFDGQPAENIMCYMVRSEVDGKLYLRFKSFGNYNGSGFNEANAYYEYMDSEFSAFYLATLALINSGASSSNLEIIALNEQYVLPYYTISDSLGTVQKSDVIISGNALDLYTVVYYTLNNTVGLEIPADFVLYEQKYREFVYNNYLSIDSSTLAFMQAIIDEYGFDPTSPTIISDIANYISSAARYDLAYDRSLDSESNIVISFLRDYKTGICQHYAASAVMLYRALGIPARYTVGYVADAKAGEFVEVKAANAHAWVEIYVDGLGWIMVEVTGASSNPEVEPPEWGGSTESPITISLTPEYIYKNYDGTPLYAENLLSPDMALQELLDKGYTYSVSISGSRTEPGRGTAVIDSFILYDESGNDVTHLYDITYNEGVIEIAYDVVKIFLYEIQKYYDGTVLEYGDGYYEVVSDLPDGVTVEVEINISMINVGWLKNSDINTHRDQYISYKVYDHGVDVSDMVIVVVDVFEGMSEDSYIPIRIDERAIELTSASASKAYDGKPLKDSDVYITKGSLANGDRIVASAIGSIIDVGTGSNMIDTQNVRIYNSKGEDVTANYDITCKEGTLTVF